MGEGMTVIKPGLFLIMQQWPSKKNILRRMYRGSRSFQTLCDDYQKCIEAMKYWTQSDYVQALERCNEYQDMMNGLENEIKERINTIK